MGERYWITGVQIGLLMGYNQNSDSNHIKDLLFYIQDNQFVGDVE